MKRANLVAITQMTKSICIKDTSDCISYRFSLLFIIINVSISNSMVPRPSAIWKSMHESEGRVQFEVFEKRTSVCFSQIARETMRHTIILINNIHERIMQSACA